MSELKHQWPGDSGCRQPKEGVACVGWPETPDFPSTLPKLDAHDLPRAAVEVLHHSAFVSTHVDAVRDGDRHSRIKSIIDRQERMIEGPNGR